MSYRIREIRESRDMSQTELAEKAGIARATLWKLETADNIVTTSSTLLKLADALGVSIGELFLPKNV